MWRYTHCTYVQYVLVRYKFACYSGPLIIIRDEPNYYPDGPFEDTEPGNVLFHRKRSNEAQISSKVDWKKHPCAAASPSSMGYAPPEMYLDANYGCNSDRLRNAASFG